MCFVLCFRNNSGRVNSANNAVELNSNSHPFPQPEAEYVDPVSFILPQAPVIPPRQPPVDEPHYEGCDMATLTAHQPPPIKPQTKQPIKSKQKPLKMDHFPDDYSHLQHK